MSQTSVPPEWKTPPEATDYRTTPNYVETVAFCQRLADASPSIEYRSFGLSGQRRDLPLLVASEEGLFSPEAAKANGKAIVLIQACIHAGEPDGKDAVFALLN